MKNEIIAAISSKLKEIYPDETMHPDSVIQSAKNFYFALSVMESGAENVGIDIRSVSFLIDIILIDDKPNRNLINKLVSRYGAFFSTITIDKQILFPKAYLPDEADGVQHIHFALEFPQCIEWSER